MFKRHLAQTSLVASLVLEALIQLPVGQTLLLWYFFALSAWYYCMLLMDASQANAFLFDQAHLTINTSVHKPTGDDTN